MPDALSEGWLIALAVGLGPTVLGGFYGLARWVSSNWRKPYERALAEKEEALELAKEVSEKLEDANREITHKDREMMYMQMKLENAEKEIEKWQSGVYRQKGG